jgi:hypothetical protein
MRIERYLGGKAILASYPYATSVRAHA